MLFNEASANTEAEFGVITASHKDSHWITETHVVSNGKTTSTCTDSHHIYTNDVEIASYDYRTYGYQFESRDWDSARNRNPGDSLSLNVYVKNKDLVGASYPIGTIPAATPTGMAPGCASRTRARPEGKTEKEKHGESQKKAALFSLAPARAG